MTRHFLPAITAALILPLVLGLGAAGVYAHGVHPAHADQPPIQGIVMGTSKQSVQVQTQSGGVSVPLATGTQVIRVVTGSTADLTMGAIVDVRVMPGTNTAQAITISIANPFAHPEHA
jgi:hypothetical protein